MTEGNQYPKKFYPKIVTQHEKIALSGYVYTKFDHFLDFEICYLLAI